MLESFGRNCFSETAIFCKNVPCSLDDIADKAKCTRAKGKESVVSISNESGLEQKNQVETMGGPWLNFW